MKIPRILVADDLGSDGLEVLRDGSAEVELRTGMDESALRSALAEGFHALVVRSATKVTRTALLDAAELAVIGRAGIGVDNIDVAAATERGVVVMNTPDASAVTTGEHAIALLVALARRIPAADGALKAGRWDKKLFTGVEMTGKTFGVVGLGNIGRVVASRGVGLGMQVLGYDPYLQQADAPPGVELVELDTLCAQSDFVSIHVPLLDATRHLFDAARIRSMKPGARLIHAARGGIVDDVALLACLQDGHLAGAALDVFEVEPLPADHPFRGMDQVVLTPHIGASTVEAKRNVGRAMANQVLTALREGVVLNGVNVPRLDPNTARAAAPYVDLTRQLTRFLAALFPGKIESLRVTLQGPVVAGAAHALTVAALAVALQGSAEQPVTPVNAEAVAERLGVRVHREESTLKADFQNLLRIELMIDGCRHSVSGTVLGRRHGRLIELDGTILDAIPEPPLLVTRHRDQPGVLGAIGQALGAIGANIVRMQMGAEEHQPGDGRHPPAWGIMNLDRPLTPTELEQVRNLDAVEQAFTVG